VALSEREKKELQRRYEFLYGIGPAPRKPRAKTKKKETTAETKKSAKKE